MGQRGYQHLGKAQSTGNDLTLEAMKTKNVIYSAIVLEEFLKEMAAVSQEHAVRRIDSIHQQYQHNQMQPPPSIVLHLSSI